MRNYKNRPISRIILSVIITFSAGLLSSHALGEEMTREKAIAIVKASHQGKILKVQEKETKAGSVYVVKILTANGRVKTVRVGDENSRKKSPKKPKHFKKSK